MKLLRRRDLVCQQAVELVTDYLEDNLSPRARRRFEAHLAGCPHCTEYLAQMVSLSMKALSLREIDGDQGLHNYILRERLLSRVIVHENRRGPVMTLGPIKMGDIRLSADRQVVNEVGQVVSVLHQYDRIPELKKILLDRVALSP